MISTAQVEAAVLTVRTPISYIAISLSPHQWCPSVLHRNLHPPPDLTSSAFFAPRRRYRRGSDMVVQRPSRELWPAFFGCPSAETAYSPSAQASSKTAFHPSSVLRRKKTVPHEVHRPHCHMTMWPMYSVLTRQPLLRGHRNRERRDCDRSAGRNRLRVQVQVRRRRANRAVHNAKAG